MLKVAMPESNSPRIKMLIVNGSLQVGGAEMQIARLVPQLDRRFFDVQVAYYNSAYDCPLEMLSRAGVPVRHLGSNRWSKRQCFQDAYDLMKQERFDLVHAWSASANHYARIPAIMAGVPVIIGGLRGKSGMERIWPYIYSLMNFRCSGWIVNSDAMGEFSSKKMYFMKNSPICIVRNGFDCSDDRIFRKDEPTTFDALKRGVPVIGIVGRLHPVKNHAMFLAMAKRLMDEGLDADFWIIGDGPERPFIESTICRTGLQGKVRLLGQRDDVDVALSRMDLLVLTSRSESCPNVLLEAMRASLPVVATDCTSLAEIVRDGVNGYVVPVDDVSRLVEKVKLIVLNRDRHREMGKNSRAIVQERFSITAAAHELEEAYRFFLKRTRKRKNIIHNKLNYSDAC